MAPLGGRRLQTAFFGCLLLGLDAAAGGRASQRRIRIIGAGFQRTATESLTAALIMLGYNPAHGMRCCFSKPFKDSFTGVIRRVPGDNSRYSPLRLPGTTSLQRSSQEFATETSFPLELYNNTVLKAWMQLADGGDPEPAYQTLMDNDFDATTADVPTYALTKELIRRFPEAKVIMSVHPKGPLEWVDSMTSLCWNCTSGFEHWMATFGAKFSPCVRELMLHGGVTNEMQRLNCVQEYMDEHKKIRDLVPPKQLLIFSPTDGWEPLCKFLGVPVPKRPYPKLSTFGTRRRAPGKLRARMRAFEELEAV